MNQEVLMKLKKLFLLVFLLSLNGLSFSALGADENETELCKDINLGMFARENMDELIEYDGTMCIFEDDVYKFNYPDIYDYRKEIYWENLTTGKVWWFKDVVVNTEGANDYCTSGKEGFRPPRFSDLPHEYSTMKLFTEVFQFQNKAESSKNLTVGFRLTDRGSENRRLLFIPSGPLGAATYMADDERSRRQSTGELLVNIPLCIKD